ncbi:hypothetical protein ACOMHN_024820 [Nucella lapillus]
MPVTGLPATVETALTALLTTNSVSSWKIAGEGDSTVVVLRLKSVDSQMSTNMAEPVLNRTQTEFFRRKSPSELRRDQERARQQKQQKVRPKEADRDMKALCVPNVPDDQPCSTDRGVEHIPTHSTDQNKKSAVTHENATSLQLSRAPDNSSVCPQPPDCEQTIDSTIAGFDTGVVKNYVASLTDRLYCSSVNASTTTTTTTIPISLLCTTKEHTLQIPFSLKMMFALLQTKEFSKAGALRGNTPADVVNSCDITFSCVSDSIAVRDAVMARGGTFLEAPVCGSRVPALEGQLIILTAGDRKLHDDCFSCFSAMGKKALYLSTILNRRFDPHFPLQHQQKDLRLVLSMGDSVEQPLYIAAAANELYKKARQLGAGEEDTSAVYKATSS